MSELYTCISCRVAFKDGDGQKNHYKSDWHRYNLKRKIADLVPVTIEEFAKRVLAQRNENLENKGNTKHCHICHKHFNSDNAYTNHVNSKKHKDNVSKPSNTSSEISSNSVKLDDTTKHVANDDDNSSGTTEELDSDEWEEEFNDSLDKYKYCLFCNHRSRSLVRNLRHMTQKHSFFIPDVEYCIDIQGLIMYLQQKVHEGFMCLWCNEKGRMFHSAEAAQDHMRDKGHCKMLHEGDTLAEYYDFYDYSSSYPSQICENNDDPQSLDATGYELVLPSGAVLGHRSLARYYRQRLTTSTVCDVRTLRRVVKHYKAVGWTGAPREETVRRARDMQRATRAFSGRSLKLGLQSNKLQHHFRPQVNF